MDGFCHGKGQTGNLTAKRLAHAHIARHVRRHQPQPTASLRVRSDKIHRLAAIRDDLR